MKDVPTLVVAGVSITQDADGRFSLNDLHRAAGGKAFPKGEPRHQPSLFMELQQTKELVAAISNSSDSLNCAPYESRAGRYGGTFVVKELVYAYANWISPSLYLKMIRAFDALATGAHQAGIDLDEALLLRLGGMMKAISTKQHLESEQRMLDRMAAMQEDFDAKLKSVMASEQVGLRHGVSAGQVWAQYGLGRWRDPPTLGWGLAWHRDYESHHRMPQTVATRMNAAISVRLIGASVGCWELLCMGRDRSKAPVWRESSESHTAMMGAVYGLPMVATAGRSSVAVAGGMATGYPWRMVPNTSMHTVKIGVGLVSKPAPSHWLLGPPAATWGRRLAQRVFLVASVAWLVWLMLWIDGLFR